MKAELVLKDHLELCEEAYRVLREENQHYRDTGTPVTESFLDRKEQIVPQIEASLNDLRRLRQTDPLGLHTHRAMVQQAQNRLMKVLMLDRENERLMLKVSIEHRPTRQSRKRLDPEW